MSAMTVSAAASHHVRPARGVRPVRPLRPARPGVRAGRPARAGRPVRAAGPAPLRLTRRGRAVVAALLLLLALAALALLRAPATASTATPGAPPVAERVTVRPGETLWQIAARAVPGVDPRDTVARIEDMNGLSSSAVQAGRVLFVPAGR